ncbi:hypothetical protein TGAM01_v208012 [Trichoderma gamsii]|uniref:Uncharacterized protein n=1 Tax=Trichoderma gamsii TaxID=398673 RepID=A0A2P4ZFF2_9HYPO|nr:hypothetical protein TGAM01_v208012 [Trichoderma gamsii]PON23007.1 hypothetical protein TGAM01_v208012 [Trichoderma gamsii]
MELPVADELKTEKHKAQVERQREVKKAKTATTDPGTGSSPQATAPEAPQHQHSLQNSMEGIVVGMANTQTPTTQPNVAENTPSSGSTHDASCETAASPVQTPHNLAPAFGAQGQQPINLWHGNRNRGTTNRNHDTAQENQGAGGKRGKIQNNHPKFKTITANAGHPKSQGTHGEHPQKPRRRQHGSEGGSGRTESGTNTIRRDDETSGTIFDCIGG